MTLRVPYIADESIERDAEALLAALQQRGRQHGRSERDSRDQLVNVVHRFDRR